MRKSGKIYLMFRGNFIYPALLLLMLSTASLKGQPWNSPYELALGGGSAIIDGPAAHFTNPANLMLPLQNKRRQLLMGTGGLYHSNGIPLDRVHELPQKIDSYFRPDDLPAYLSMDQIPRIWVTESAGKRRQSVSYTFIPAGFSWKRATSARSFAIRSRGYSTFEMFSSRANGPFDEIDSPSGSFSRNYHERYQVYHEISVAFAREVTMFNHWQSGMNSLFLGFSPKMIIAGMHNEIRFNSLYAREDGFWENTKSMQVSMAGDFTGYLQDLLKSGEPSRVFREHLGPYSNTGIHGAGMGINAGLTYVIPFSSDLSLSPHIAEPLRKSLIFSISLQDFGLIRYSNNASRWKGLTEKEIYEELPGSEASYSGQPGEFFRFILDNQDESIILDELKNTGESYYYVQMPAALIMGSAFQYRWISTLADIGYQFNSPFINSGGWSASLGMKIRVLRMLNMMGSIQNNPENGAVWGMGAGIDFGSMSLAGALRFYSTEEDSFWQNWHTDSVSVLSLTIRF